jgi:hypothetical protein
MNRENPEYPEKKEQTKALLDAALTLPDRRRYDNPCLDLPRKLGEFLVENGYVNDLKVWLGSWGKKYMEREKTIYLNEKPMPHDMYNRYFFRLGQNQRGQDIFPSEGDEADRYGILHETNHAYQLLLMDIEAGSKEAWYGNIMNSRFGTTVLDRLVQLCLYVRMTSSKGLTLWGSQPDYNSIENRDVNLIARSVEDANELVTMAIWHPDYFALYLNYLAGQIPEYSLDQVIADGLQPITPEQKKSLQDIMGKYIQTMRQVIETES